MALSLLRRRRNTGPVYELLAKYAVKIVRVEAWPEADSCDTDGSDVVAEYPALHEGAQE